MKSVTRGWSFGVRLCPGRETAAAGGSGDQLTLNQLCIVGLGRRGRTDWVGQLTRDRLLLNQLTSSQLILNQLSRGQLLLNQLIRGQLTTRPGQLLLNQLSRL